MSREKRTRYSAAGWVYGIFDYDMVEMERMLNAVPQRVEGQLLSLCDGCLNTAVGLVTEILLNRERLLLEDGPGPSVGCKCGERTGRTGKMH